MLKTVAYITLFVTYSLCLLMGISFKKNEKEKHRSTKFFVAGTLYVLIWIPMISLWEMEWLTIILLVAPLPILLGTLLQLHKRQKESKE